MYQPLLDLDAVRIDPSRRRVCSDLMGNAQQLRVDKSKDARFVDQPGQILGTHRDVAARDQLAQAPDNLPGTKGRRLSRFQRLTQLRQAPPLTREIGRAPGRASVCT